MQVMTFEEINAVSGAAQTINLTGTLRNSCFSAVFDDDSGAAIAHMVAIGNFSRETSADFGPFRWKK